MSIEESIIRAIVYALTGGTFLGWTVILFFLILRKLY